MRVVKNVACLSSLLTVTHLREEEDLGIETHPDIPINIGVRGAGGIVMHKQVINIPSEKSGNFCLCWAKLKIMPPPPRIFLARAPMLMKLPKFEDYQFPGPVVWTGLTHGLRWRYTVKTLACEVVFYN